MTRHSPHFGPDARLRELGITLPEPTPPGGAYSPTVERVGERNGTLFIAAQFPIEPGVPARESRYRGRLGDTLTTADGYDAARLAAVNALARIRHDLGPGGFDRLIGLNHLAGTLLTTPDFVEHARVMDGASDLFNAVLGERGTHTRSLVGIASHPLGLCVQLVLSATVRPAG